MGEFPLPFCPRLSSLFPNSSKIVLSEKFRRQLCQEAERWLREGIIDGSTYEKLAHRYQFSDLDRVASNRFTALLMGLGGILMGLGTLIFVAANWEAWSRFSRLILLLSLFFSVNGTGFYLWRKPTMPRSYRQLGQGLLLLGAIVFGANMVLMSQLFGDRGNVYELFLAWGLGVALVSASLRLTSLGVLAAILLQIGYWIGRSSSSIAPEWSWGQIIIEHMPLVGCFLLIPLAYWCRSPALFGLGAIAVMSSFLANLLRFQGWALELAIGLPPALFWAYRDRLWQWGRWRGLSSVLESRFRAIARRLAVLFLSAVLYIFSFNIWNYLKLGNLDFDRWQSLRAFIVDIAIVSALTLLGWLQLRSPDDSTGGSPETRDRFQSGQAVNNQTVAALILPIGILVCWHLHVAPIALLGTIAMNIMLFLFSISLVRDGLAAGIRRTFWGGTLLLSLSIVSRMLEYNTGLLLKSLVFVLCGVGAIVAGLAFEQTLKKSQPLSIPPSSQEEDP